MLGKYIQEPNNLQSFNRYSYVWNNPLSKTDPSGFVTKGLDTELRGGDGRGEYENYAERIAPAPLVGVYRSAPSGLRAVLGSGRRAGSSQIHNDFFSFSSGGDGEDWGYDDEYEPTLKELADWLVEIYGYDEGRRIFQERYGNEFSEGGLDTGGGDPSGSEADRSSQTGVNADESELGKGTVESELEQKSDKDESKAAKSGEGKAANAAAALAYQYSSGNNTVSRASTPKPAPKPASKPVPQLKTDRGGGRSLPIPKYVNSPEYLRNVDLNFGMSANPITAEFNGKLFGAIGAGALGGTVLVPAAGSAYGAASSLTLDLSIKTYAAGTAAAGAIGNAASTVINAGLQNATTINQIGIGIADGAPSIQGSANAYGGVLIREIIINPLSE